MIQDDHIDSALFQASDGLHGGGSAIDREQERSRASFQAVIHGVLTQAITFLEAVGQVGLGFPAQTA